MMNEWQLSTWLGVIDWLIISLEYCVLNKENGGKQIDLKFDKYLNRIVRVYHSYFINEFLRCIVCFSALSSK